MVVVVVDDVELAIIIPRVDAHYMQTLKASKCLTLQQLELLSSGSNEVDDSKDTASMMHMKDVSSSSLMMNSIIIIKFYQIIFCCF